MKKSSGGTFLNQFHITPKCSCRNKLETMHQHTKTINTINVIDEYKPACINTTNY